jgi:RimJ/RimL family protein N-acetyltransferase
MPLITDPRLEPSINQWVEEQGGGRAQEGSYRALGWYREDPVRITGGLVFYNSNAVNCFVSIALEKGVNPRGLLSAGMSYAFGQLALRRLTFSIASYNLPSIKLVTDLGSICEGSLRSALPEGDLHIYALFSDKCPLWSKLNGRRSNGRR